MIGTLSTPVSTPGDSRDVDAIVAAAEVELTRMPLVPVGVQYEVLIRCGLTRAEIAARYGVSRSHVRHALMYAGKRRAAPVARPLCPVGTWLDAAVVLDRVGYDPAWRRNAAVLAMGTQRRGHR